MMKKLLFIYNPKAGRAAIGNHLGEIIDTFTKAGYEVTIYPTQCQGDGEVKAKERCNDFDRIIVSGGDGTLDEIVTGIMEAESKTPIGYIPAGSTNDFARSLGLPKIMKRAAAIAVRDSLFSCDIGRFNDRYFVYVAAFGLFTDVTYETDQKRKNRFGYGAYLAEAIKRLQSIESIPLRISYDGNVIRDNFLVGMVTNSASVGGIKGITGPDVKLNDGVFEVLLVKAPESLIDLNLIPPAILDRRIKSDCVISFKCSELKVESDEPISWTLDGEFGGCVDKTVITNIREGINIAVDR